jgi:hypothetical protein
MLFRHDYSLFEFCIYVGKFKFLNLNARFIMKVKNRKG